MKYNKHTEEEIKAMVKDIAKERGFDFPEYDNCGNVKVAAEDDSGAKIVAVMRAEDFHNAIKKMIKQ